jgi:hypothetical protein
VPTEITDDRDRRLAAQMAARCEPFDRCVLACIESGCGNGIAGGCFHLCGPHGFKDPLDGAAKFNATQLSGRCP